MRALPAVIAVTLAASTPSLAQKPAAPSPAPAAAATEPSKDSLKEIVERETAPRPNEYQYQPTGRRDPFVSLLANVGPSEVPKQRPQGLPGMLVQELALRGIVKDRTGFVAMLAAPDGKSYFARVGQRCYDGVITAMDQATVSFRQEVQDPLSPVKTRDVKKSLYTFEEARQ
jgi:type IV pilus assembly protein PilP